MTQTNETQTQTQETTTEVSEQQAVETIAETPQEKLLTQAEFEEALKKRLDRERKKYEGFDDLKTKASEYETLLEEKRLAELSEKERADELAKKYEADTQSLTAQLEALRKQSQDDKIRNAFRTVASSAGIAYIDDAIALADLSAVSIGEDGKVEGVDDVVKALVENKPFLVAKAKSQPIGQATNGGQQTDKSAETLLAELRAKAKSSGRIEDRVAFDKLNREIGK